MSQKFYVSQTTVDPRKTYKSQHDKVLWLDSQLPTKFNEKVNKKDNFLLFPAWKCFALMEHICRSLAAYISINCN